MSRETRDIYHCDRCKKEINAPAEKVHCVNINVEILSLDGCYPELAYNWKHLCADCRKPAVQFFGDALK